MGEIALEYEGGEGPAVCVRETVGWRHVTDKASVGYRRQVKMICREIFVGKHLHLDSPQPPGLGAAWEMLEARGGRTSFSGTGR